MEVPHGQPESTLPTLLLASGLSVTKPNSFSRQLDLLGNELFKRGHPVVITGKSAVAVHDPGDDHTEGKLHRFDVEEYNDETLSHLKARFGINRCVLIGYPDQFPFLLQRQKLDAVYFWYQCSKPSFHPGLQTTVPIPLTGKTEGFLKRAGHPRIGPIIPHGIDTALFTPAKRDRPPKSREPVICSVGANSIRKRFDLLFESFSRLLESVPAARLAIKTDCSSKPGGYHLRQIAERCGILPRLTLVEGELSDEKMAAFYRSADCYVHTAEWEGFGIPVVEAMACGIPVVTHGVQGPGEIVPYTDLLQSDSESIDEEGILLRRVEPSSVADCLSNLIDSHELANRIAAMGRREAVEAYDIRAVADQWENVLLKDSVVDPPR